MTTSHTDIDTGTTNKILLLSMALLTLLLAGCSGNQDSSSGSAKTPTAPELLWGIGSEIQGLDPQIVTGVPENRVLSSMCEGLVSEDGKDGFEPALAESWTISDDGLIWEFKIRQSAVWSDGTPITAETVRRSWQRILTPSLGSQYQNMLYFIDNAEAFYQGKVTDFNDVGIEAVDDHTLRIHLRHPTPYLESLLAHYSTWPVPVHVIERTGDFADRNNPWARPQHFVCNGAYKLDDWKTNVHLKVVKSPTYWNSGVVSIDQIKFLPIEDNTTEFRMFRAGELDITSTVPLAELDKLNAPDNRDPSLRIEPYYGTYFYRLNTTRPPLHDARVRHALAMAVDRHTLVRKVTKAGEIPANTFTPLDPAIGFIPTNKIEFNPQKARELLAEAGYPNGEGMRPIELMYNTSEGHRRIALAIQESWRKHLGINVQISNQEWKVYLQRQRNLDFDISRAGWIGDYFDPTTFLDIMVTGRGNNETGFASEEFDGLLEQANYISGQERMNLLMEAEQVLMDTQPVIPIYYYTTKYLISDRVKNWHANILDRHPPKYLRLEQPVANSSTSQ